MCVFFGMHVHDLMSIGTLNKLLIISNALILRLLEFLFRTHHNLRTTKSSPKITHYLFTHDFIYHRIYYHSLFGIVKRKTFLRFVNKLTHFKNCSFIKLVTILEISFMIFITPQKCVIFLLIIKK